MGVSNDIFKQKSILDSFEIIVDTREQATDRAERRYSDFASPYKKQALLYGDYTYNLYFENEPLYITGVTIEPKTCVIERKMNLDELANCFTRERKRFQNEFEKALNNSCKVYLIVENASWENLINKKYRSLFNSKAYLASLTAWLVRYDITPIFCKAETSGKLIKEILYRDAKERIEKGYFDE